MLVNLLLEAGLLQFGRFANNGGWQPYRLSLHLLPSYPYILHCLVELATPRIGTIDHLVCPATAIPFGVALGQSTGIPLVYSYSSDVVIGAYDIGHPALLVANTLSDVDELERLVVRAKQVGLEISRVLVIADEGTDRPQGIEVEALLDLPTTVQTLMQEGRLPAGQAQAVTDWISLRHPDSEAP
jgi:hypothetical protein